VADNGKLLLRLQERADVDLVTDVDSDDVALRPRLGISIGATLAAARAEQGLSLAEAEQLTCLRTRFLSALEHDEFERLPGHAYTRAFIRTYATALGLDADHLVEEFEEQDPEPPEALAPPPPPGASRLRFVRPAAVVVGGVLFLWILWTVKHSGAPGSRPSSAAAAAPPLHQAPPPAPVHHPRAVASVPVAPAVLVLDAARGRCWVLARRGGPTGAVLTERTLEQGDVLRLGSRGVWLRLGAPWNVRLRRGAHAIDLPPATGPIDTYVS
jgi:hypothetical protein